MNIGDRIDQYTIIRSLGAGGMSEVYLVEDNLGRHYAMKVLSARLTGDDAFRERFKVEAKVMASLNHPNIIGLHSYFEEQGNYCLVMEYLEGGSLKDLIRRSGPLPEERALPIFHQIAEALAHAHSQGIIHRDIKPSNIMISADGQYKLGDFGIARMQETEGLTRTGSRMGTLIYMSPEQIKDTKHVDAKTDVYSLGVTFYETLTGRVPYDETTESDFNIMNKIVQQNLPDPRVIYPHISQPVVDLMWSMTIKDPIQRISVSAVAAAVSSGIKNYIPKQPPKNQAVVPEGMELTDGYVIYESRKWVLTSRYLLGKGDKGQITEKIALESITSIRTEKYLTDPDKSYTDLLQVSVVLGAVVFFLFVYLVIAHDIYSWFALILGVVFILAGFVIYLLGRSAMKKLIISSKGEDIVLMDFLRSSTFDEIEAKRLLKEISAFIR